MVTLRRRAEPLLLLLLLAPPATRAQVPDSLVLPPFVNVQANVLHNDSLTLKNFYEKLYKLRQRQIDRVNVVHIGDSHIQADFFSGMLRENFQREYGNAGRGFVFPYRVAKSNEPRSYKSSTNVDWEYKRNVFLDKSLPIGVGGFTIETRDTSAEINLRVIDPKGLGYGFTKFTLFHEKGKGSYDITVCDSLQCVRGVIDSKKQDSCAFASVVRFDKPMKQVILHANEKDSTARNGARIYGMMLENDSAGLLYNMIGVNGAEYRHYNRSQHFIEQMSYLKPDLVIVSLGTNEGFNIKFDSANFYKQIDTLVTSIRAKNPGVNLLISTPPDSFRKVRKGKKRYYTKNPQMLSARNTIIYYCRQNGVAYWDLYEVMGGYGSMGLWYKAKLTDNIRLHFSGKGYQMQGNLFYKAISDGYRRFEKHRP